MVKSSTAIIGGVAAFGVVLLLGLLQWVAKPGLDRSALGVDGLALLAPELGLKIETPRQFSPPKASQLSLRILALYDMDLNSSDLRPASREERLGQTTLRELDADLFYKKIDELPTLVVLPKWRGGVMETGAAAREFLVPLEDFRVLRENVLIPGAQLQRAVPDFTTESIAIGTDQAKVALFYPQTLQRGSMPENCSEIMGLRQGALMIRCGENTSRLRYYLFDPDLLNNHGITLGENARIVQAALAMLQKPQEARPIYLDPSSPLLLAPNADKRAQPYERDTDMLLRLFAWPLSLLWLAAGGVFAVAIWRGSMRFGPVKRLPDDRLEQSKLAAIDAKARLIRMARNDGRMVAEFVQNHLLDLAEQTFGRGAGEAGVARLYARFARVDAAQTASLRAVAARLGDSAKPMSEPEMRRHLDQFKLLVERLSHGPF